MLPEIEVWRLKGEPGIRNRWSEKKGANLHKYKVKILTKKDTRGSASGGEGTNADPHD